MDNEYYLVNVRSREEPLEWNWIVDEGHGSRSWGKTLANPMPVVDNLGDLHSTVVFYLLL